MKNSTLLCFFFVFIKCFILIPCFGSTLPVSSLEWGKCWVGAEGQIKLVSFQPQNKGQSFVFTKKDWAFLYEDINIFIREKNINIPEIATLSPVLNSFVQCRSDGMRLFLNYYQNIPKICVHVLLDKKDFFKVLGVYPNHEGPEGICEGQYPGTLLLMLPSNTQTQRNCRLHLKENMKNIIFQVEEQSSYVILKLNSEFYFQENIVKEQILQDEECGQVLTREKIEYNSLRLSPGEYIKILSDHSVLKGVSQ